MKRKSGRKGGNRADKRPKGEKVDDWSNFKVASWRFKEKENKLLENYYVNVGVVSPEEKDAWMDALKRPLPTTFRVLGGSEETDYILQRLQKDFREFPVTVEEVNRLEKLAHKVRSACELRRKLNNCGAMQSLLQNGMADEETNEERPNTLAGTEQSSEEKAPLEKAETERSKTDKTDGDDDEEDVEDDDVETQIEPPSALSWYPGGLAWRYNFSKRALKKAKVLKDFHNVCSCSFGCKSVWPA